MNRRDFMKSSIAKKGDRVLIKPNFSLSNAPDAATTTSPELVKEVVLMCKEAGAKRVTVADHTIRVAGLATVIKPQLTILDATRCLTTNGPSGPGEVVNLGKVMCSTDTVALDAYATTLLDWGGKTLKPEDIGHIKFAAEHGLGEMDLAKVEIVEVMPVKTG